MVEKPRTPAGDPTGGQVAHHRGTEPDVTLDPALVDVLESAARLQQLVPDAVLVGDSAAAAYAGHRLSFDHDHVVDVLEALEAEGEWVTNRVRPGKVILGQIGDIEAGVRQLIRRTPLEVTELTLPSGAKVRVPTPDETLRIKAFLIVKRNQVRDYLDVAALADRYDGAGRGVASQVIRQLADPRPADTATIKDLARYKGLAPRWHRWSDVVAVCRLLAAAIQDVPWGQVARYVKQAVAIAHPYGVSEVMTDIVAEARQAAEESERAQVAAEVRHLIGASGWTQARFAAGLGTSPSRLSTYVTGSVVPSATLMVRMRRVAADAQEHAPRMLLGIGCD